MKFENLKKLSGGQFRRITGVKPNIFATMVKIIKQADEPKMDPGSLPGMTKTSHSKVFFTEYHTQIGFEKNLLNANTTSK